MSVLFFIRSNCEVSVSVLMTKLWIKNTWHTDFCFLSVNISKGSLDVRWAAEVVFIREFPFDLCRFCSSCILKRDHSPSATGWNLSRLYDLLSLSLCSLPPFLTFLLSLWRSHNSWAALQKELNASQQLTLSLGERKDHIKIKKAEVWKCLERDAWMPEDCAGSQPSRARFGSFMRLLQATLSFVLSPRIPPERMTGQIVGSRDAYEQALPVSESPVRKPQGHNLAPGRALFYWLLISEK